MSDTSETFNPYQPPAVLEEPEAQFGPDTEFLISDREILCGEEVTLPRICIHTGDTDNLEVRQRLFHSVAGFWAIGLVTHLLLLIVLFVWSAWFAGIFVLILCLIGGMFLQPLLVRLRAPGMLTVDATWYVSQRYLQRARRRALLMRLGLSSVLGSVFFFGSLADGWPIALISGSIAAVVAGLVSLLIRSEKSLQFGGRRHFGIHKGLKVLTGHSRHFTAAVNRVIHGSF